MCPDPLYKCAIHKIVLIKLKFDYFKNFVILINNKNNKYIYDYNIDNIIIVYMWLFSKVLQVSWLN